jgi:hypothetical protein
VLSAQNYFGVSEDALERASESVLADYRRFPLFHWERRDRGYSSPSQRTLSNAEDYLIHQNAQLVSEAECSLRPCEKKNEITAIITISPVEGEIERKLVDVKNYILNRLNFRHWECFVEPSERGRPHSALYVLTHRRNLKDLHKKLDKVRKDEGRSSIVHLIVSKEADWARKSESQFPWPIGYFVKNALNKDRILSFASWAKGRRWYSRCTVKELRERSLSPSSFIPDDYVQNLSIESTTEDSPDPVDVNVNPLNFHESEKRRIARLQAEGIRLRDEKTEHEGRNLNDRLSFGEYIVRDYPDLLDKFGLPNPDLAEKYINLIEKALESRDESTLAIVRSSIQAEADAARERAEKPQKEKEKRMKTVIAAFLRTSKAIRTKSKDIAIFETATAIHNAVQSEDKETLRQFGLDRRNALIFDLQEVKIVSQDIYEKITEYDGESDSEKKKIMREINSKLRAHLHTLMYAELHIFIQKFREKSQLFEGERLEIANEILEKIDKKIGAHRKATCQGFWLKRAIIKAMNGDAHRLREMLEEIDFRSDKTRASHGRKPLKDSVRLVEDNHEVRARQKTKKIRQIELQKAQEAAEKAAQPKVRKPRKPRKKPTYEPAKITP